MPSLLYCAMFSALTAAKPLPTFSKRIIAGDFKQALKSVYSMQDQHDSQLGESDIPALQAMADALLLLGQYEEAEEAFRKVQKLLRNNKEQIRIVTRRNTGWQALSQNRFSVALNCFSANVEDHTSTDPQRIEAMAGVAMTHYRLGQQSAANDVLKQAVLLAQRQADKRWDTLLECLNADCNTQFLIRSTGQLRDHVFWHSSATQADPNPQHAARAVQLLRSRLADMPLMQARFSYLNDLLSVCEGSKAAYDSAMTHAQWARTLQFMDYHKAVKLEITLALLSQGFADLAEKTLGTNQEQAPLRWNIEYMYCMAKIRMHQGNMSEGFNLYHRYALNAVQCLRTETHIIKPLCGPMKTSTQMPTDDIGARLPAKYRRAYRYMLDHIDRSDLSVREIATHIGVTERALQLAFKESVGMSPSEVINRHRMERIREELLDTSKPNQSILETARRWGVKNRSTLISSYRKQFDETPTQTLKNA